MSKLGNRFSIDVDKIKTRSFTYGGHTFKVRMPTLAQINAYEAHLEEQKANTTLIEAIYQERIKGLVPSAEVVFSDNDVVVAGRSVREAAINQIVTEIRITWFFNLLVKEVDDGLGDLTYEDINAELPVQVQVEMSELIAGTMFPDIAETKKKSIETPPSSSNSTSEATA